MQLDPNNPDDEIEFSEIQKYGIILACYIPVGFLFIFFNRWSWGILGENLSKNMRAALYGSILRKHIGWFDHKDNSPG